MLWNSNIVFFFLCGLLRFGVCQGAEEEEGQEDIKSILQTMKRLDLYLRLQFEELESDQADISANFEDLRERLDGLNESHMAVQGKVEELHDRMIVMEGHMVELQASSKPDSILQTCVQSLEMVIPCVSPSHLIPTLGCITPVREEMIWEDAKKNCIDQGSRLIEKISTQSEMNQLKEHFEDFLNTGANEKVAWIGMRGRRWIEGGDLLEDSSPLWRSGQPKRGDTECVYIDLGRSPPVLYDNPCSPARLHSLCQRMNPTE